MLHHTCDQLVITAKFRTGDVDRMNLCRRSRNELVIGYQLAFVKLFNRFPDYPPFEVVDEILAYVGIQLSIAPGVIHRYSNRFQTIYEHQEQIRTYLGFRKLDDPDIRSLRQFIFDNACRLEQPSALMAKTTEYLWERRILTPSEDTLKRLIGAQKEEARKHIFRKISEQLSDEIKDNLNSLLDSSDRRQSGFNILKTPPLKPSPQAINKLTKNLDIIGSTGAMRADLSWLSNNFQRMLAHQARHYTVARVKRLMPARRYATMVCFLQQGYRDTIDYLVDMFDKLINRIYSSAQHDIGAYNTTSIKQVRKSLSALQIMEELFLDENVEDSVLRQTFFDLISRDEFIIQIKDVKAWLNGKHSHVFNFVKERFTYVRQFSPALLRHLHVEIDSGERSSLIDAVDLLREMNDNHKRRLPEDAPIDFIPKKIVPMVEAEGKIDKHAWESALLTAIRDEIKSGNLSVKMSKRFGRFDDFFIPQGIGRT